MAFVRNVVHVARGEHQSAYMAMENALFGPKFCQGAGHVNIAGEYQHSEQSAL